MEDRDTGMTRDGTQKIMSDFLTRYPDLAAVYAVNDPVAYYCEQAALQASRTNLFIVGMEGSPRSVEAMKDTARLIEASPGEDPFALAEIAVQRGAAILRGESPRQESILFPFTPLDRANVQRYRGWSR